jgi:streptogramin lyase
VLVAALCACSAGTGTPSDGLPGTGGAAASSKTAGSAKLELRVKIPRGRDRRAHYLSASTRSIVVVEGTKHLGTFNTSGTSTGCAFLDGDTFCTFKIGMIPGPHKTFLIQSYDQAGGLGSLLSQGQITRAITRGLNVLPITMHGIVHSIDIERQGDSPDAGAPATVALTIMAQDPDGNVIVGPGSFQQPITLSVTGTPGAIVLSTTSVTGPDQTVTATYSGVSIVSASITAAADGVLPADVTSATIAPQPTAVGDFQVPHSATKTLQEPTAIVVGPDGNIWAPISDATNGIVKMTTSGVMTFYIAGSGPSAALPQVTITGLAAGSDGNVWYSDQGSIGKITPTGSVTDYPLAGPNICASASGGRIVPAAKSDGGFWFTVQCKGDSELGHATTNGVMSFYSLHGLDAADGLALATDGNVYVAGSASASGDAGVIQALVSGATIGSVNVLDIDSLQSVALIGIAQSTDGDLWVTTGSCAPSALVRLHLSASFASTNVGVFPTLAGCALPYFLTAASDGTLWVPNFAHPTATRVIPRPYPAAPLQRDILLPTPGSVPGNEAEAVIGPDGDVYIADESTGTPDYAGDIVKIAY